MRAHAGCRPHRRLRIVIWIVKDTVSYLSLTNAPKIRLLHKRRLRKAINAKSPAIAVYSRVPLLVGANMAVGLFPLHLVIQHPGGREQVSIRQPHPWDSLRIMPISAGDCQVTLISSKPREIEVLLRDDELMVIYARAAFGFRSKRSHTHKVFWGIVSTRGTGLRRSRDGNTTGFLRQYFPTNDS